MNVNDQWMLERMQQMAANMAASLPQTSQNNDAGKTEKGESFQDLINKAKDQKVEAPKKDAAKKPETVQDKTPVQKTEQPREAETVKNPDGTTTKKVNLTAQEAAMVAAGYAALSPVQPDGTVWLAVAVGEGSVQNNPLVDQIVQGVNPTGMAPDFSAYFVDDEWVVEPSEELTAALEQLLAKTGDPRSVESILSGLEEKLQNVQPQIEIVVSAPEAEGLEQAVQFDDRDDTDLDASAMADRQPLFKDVKAAPVKVGDNFQLDMEQPDMEANLADTIRFAAQQGLKQIEIKLSPENLGALTIKLTQSADGALQVVLRTGTAKAANLLAQHMDGLNAALQGYGQNNEVRVEVQRNEDSQQAQQQQQQTDPNGHNQQQQQQQQSQEESHSGDFLQKLRLGLFSPEDM